jgi:hypothetical protein
VEESSTNAALAFAASAVAATPTVSMRLVEKDLGFNFQDRGAKDNLGGGRKEVGPAAGACVPSRSGGTATRRSSTSAPQQRPSSRALFQPAGIVLDLP